MKRQPSYLLLASLLITASAAVQAQSPPSITNDLTNVTVAVGGTATLSIGVAGAGPLTCQWFFNGTNPVNNIISTVAGNGTEGYSGDGGPATSAELYFALGVAVDSLDNLFIADNFNNRIRKVGANGIITTVAGNGYGAGDSGSGAYAGDGGAATNAGLYGPWGVAVDSIGNLFIADQVNNRIRQVGTNGIITTVAGNGYGAGTGVGGYSGDGGPATNAELGYPAGVAVDSIGNLFVADEENNCIRRVDTNGIIITVAGNGYGAGKPGSGGYSGDGGPATNAELWDPTGVAVDSIGNLFIAEQLNNRIRRVDTNGIITTVAGNGYGAGTWSGGYSGDGGPATNAELNSPAGVAVDSIGNLFIADGDNSRIREVGANGIITTVAGKGFGVGKSGNGYAGDGGYATNAELDGPSGVAMDGVGNVFIADIHNQRIRKVAQLNVPTLLLNNVGAGNAGNYSVVISSPYGSVTSTVATLTVALPPLTANIVPTTANSTLAVQLQFSGTIGSNYVLEYTTNLSPPFQWQPVITNAVDASGNWTFTDTNAGAFPARFFRMATP